MEETTLSDMQKDALKELANIGVGHASTALSKMVHKTIKMAVPKVDVIPLEQIADCVKDEKIVVGIFLKVSGEIPSYVLLLIPRDGAFPLADMLQGQQLDRYNEVLSEMDKSTLQEIGNVMVSAFFDSLAKILDISAIPGPPVLAYDMSVAVMDYVLIRIGEIAEEVVVFDLEVCEEKGNRFNINMFLMPEPKSVEIVLKKLGVSEITL